MILPHRASDIWVYLSASPLFWLTAVMVSYLFSDWLSEKSGRHPLVNTVAISAAILSALILLTGTSYQTFFDGAQFVHFLLGPATVALAIPLYRNLGRVRANLMPMLFALTAGSITAIVTAVSIAGVLGAPPAILASLAPKSATTPIAMSLAATYGGISSLSAVFVLMTGIFGAIIVSPLMNALGIRDFAARGFAAGLAAHGLGTARAFQVDPTAGAFAGIALGLNGAMTAIIIPIVLPFLLHLFSANSLIP
jgi:predicted murein hydrolase (TIGR00659 family)